MLQVQFIRENRQRVLDGLEKRNFKNPEAAIDKILVVDKDRRHAQLTLDKALSELNTLSKQIGKLFGSGEVQKANSLKDKTIELKSDIKENTKSLNIATEKLTSLLYEIPNVLDKSVIAGASSQDNQEVYREDITTDLGKNALPHWELARKYDIINFDLGTKVTGAGFPVYKGKVAKLQRALIHYFLEKNISAGYTEYQVPLLINESSGIATGQLPDKEGQMYHVSTDDLYLIPTSEVPLLNTYRDKLLKKEELPIALTGYTPCFRREAGSYGADVRGLNRLHQFDKVELVRIEHPDNSYDALETMVKHVQTILRELKLPYRILRLCGGDTGFTSALTFDFEVLSAAQNRWLEVSSVSNCENFQTNRLKIRFKNELGKSQLAHTLNGSSLALPRILAGILENNQTDKGIKIPEVLVSYCGFDKID